MLVLKPRNQTKRLLGTLLSVFAGGELVRRPGGPGFDPIRGPRPPSTVPPPPRGAARELPDPGAPCGAKAPPSGAPRPVGEVRPGLRAASSRNAEAPRSSGRRAGGGGVPGGQPFGLLQVRVGGGAFGNSDRRCLGHVPLRRREVERATSGKRGGAQPAQPRKAVGGVGGLERVPGAQLTRAAGAHPPSEATRVKRGGLWRPTELRGGLLGPHTCPAGALGLPGTGRTPWLDHGSALPLPVLDQCETRLTLPASVLSASGPENAGHVLNPLPFLPTLANVTAGLVGRPFSAVEEKMGFGMSWHDQPFSGCTLSLGIVWNCSTSESRTPEGGFLFAWACPLDTELGKNKYSGGRSFVLGVGGFLSGCGLDFLDLLPVGTSGHCDTQGRIGSTSSTRRRIPWPGRESALGTQTLSKGTGHLQRGTLSTQNRGAAMSRNETAPDSRRTEHGQTSDVSGSRRRRESARALRARWRETSCDHPGKIWVHLKAPAGGIPWPARVSSRHSDSQQKGTGPPLERGLCPRRTGRRHEQERDSSRHSQTEHGQTSDVSGSRRRRESARALRARWRETSCDHPGKIWVHLKAPAGGIPWPGATRAQGHPTERDSVHAEQGAAMSRNETAQNTHGLSTDKPQMCPVAVDAGNPLERSEQDGGRQAVTPREDLGPPQGTSRRDPMARRESALGTQTLSKGTGPPLQRGTLSAAHRQGAAMSRNETAPDTHGLSTDKPQMCPVAVGAGNPLERSEQDGGRQAVTTQGRSGSTSRHQQEGSHGQARVSSRHSDSQQGTGPPLERDSVHAEGAAMSRNETAPDTHGLSTDKPQMESAVSPASDSERSEQDAGRQAVTTQGRSGSTSRHQQEGSHGQARVSSRHSDSQQGHRATPTERDSVHAEGAAMSRNETAPDTHGLSTDKPQMCPVAVDAGIRSLRADGGRQAVTTQGRSGSTSRHQQEGSHGQARVSSRHSDSQQGHRATPTERDSVHAEGAAMSRNETAPDTHGLSTEQPQMCPVAVDAGNPLAPSKMRETSCDHQGRSWVHLRHQQEGSHGQARVSSRHSDSQQGHRATPTERDSVHAEQGRRHEQERDSSRHSRTEHGQTSDVSGSPRQRQRALRANGGRQAVTTQGRSGSTSRHQQEGSHGQARVSSRHSDSQQGHRATPTERDSVHAEGAAMSRNETAPDTHRLSTDKPQMCSVAITQGIRRALEQDEGRQAVTTQGRSGSTSRHQQEGSHGQARVSSRHSDSQQGHRASPRERDSVHAEGAAMSRNETAPDTHGLSTDKPQMCPVAVDAGNPLAPSKMRETSCDHPGRSGSTSRHQQEGSHGQARVALGTRTSQQGHRATPTERDSVHAEQGRRHEQERDSSRHSRTEHGQTSDVFGSRTRRESSVSPASDSERSSKSGVHLKAPAGGDPMARRESALGTQTLSKGTGPPYREGLCPRRTGAPPGRNETAPDTHRLSTDKPQMCPVAPGQRQRALRARWRETSCDHPGKIWVTSRTQAGGIHGQRESALGTQTLSKGTGPPLQRGTLSACHRQGRRHEQERDSSDTHGLSTDKPQMCPVAPASDSERSDQNAGRQAVTTQGRSGSTSRHQPEGSHGQARVSSRHSDSQQGHRAPLQRGTLSTQNRGAAMSRNETAPDTHGLSTDKPQMCPVAVGRRRNPERPSKMQGDKLVTTQGRSGSTQGHSRRDPMARRESALGTQTLSKGTGATHREGLCPRRTGRRMSRRTKTAPDTHGLSTDKPQMCPVAVDAGNPLAPSKMQGDKRDHQGRSGSTSRHQQEGSHGQARVSSRHSDSQQGHRATPTERDSVHAEQGRRHEQERDSSRHSRTEHGQTSDVSGSRRRRESARALRAKMEETSCDHPGKIWVHLKGTRRRDPMAMVRVSSRHSDSQQGHRATPTERDSVHAEGAAMSRNETAPDTHGLSTDKPQMCPVAVGAGNPLERSEQDAGRQAVTTQGRSGSTSRHQQEGSHGQARVSSRHSDSQQGHRASPRERDSVHAEQGLRHEQERDSSKHSRTEHGQTSDVSGSPGPLTGAPVSGLYSLEI
ncbi:hypothetical protein Cadr_000024796 [Camelus dromedarius]|uniref:Uncharacterized protein n=1 Tax=Camelus dromedarius TaxID=9838 RepID=A0A5N4CPD1_CAMDR|nr:hypothetical protein Cadr_000024796 [Camelus dromedarius]